MKKREADALWAVAIAAKALADETVLGWSVTAKRLRAELQVALLRIEAAPHKSATEGESK